jgi:hypothetical protein
MDKNGLKGYSSYLVLGMTLICLHFTIGNAMGEEEKEALKVTSGIIKKQIAPKLAEAKKKMTKKTLRSIGMDQVMAQQVGAAIAIGKAVSEKKLQLKLNKNFDIEVDLSNDNDRKVKLGFTKGF